MSLGVGATFAPAASSALIFSAAVPFPPAMIAPACPIRFPSGAVVPAMKEATGLFKALAQLGPVRARTLPEVPTARDLGFDIVISSERGFAAPRGVAPDIMDRLQKAIAAAVTDPEFLRGTTSDELAVSYLSGSDWMKSMAERKARYAAIWGGAK